MAVVNEAEYVVSIAADMPAGESTIEALNEITAKLMGAGRGADHFQEAIAQASNALAAAKTKVADANTALSEANARYSELEKAALQAAKAQERAALKGAVPPEIARQAAEAQAAVDKLAGELTQLEAAAAAAKAEEDKLATTLANVKKISAHVDKTLAAQAETIGKLQGGLGALGGPLGALGNKILGPVKGFQELSNTMGVANATALVAGAGVAALAAAVVAVTAAVVAGTIAIAAWAVKLADGARNAGLARAAVEAMNPEIAALRETIDGVNDATGIGTDRLGELAKSLKGAGVSAEALPEALEAAALAERALGSGGASEFIESIKAAKGEVGDLAATTKSKLGGIVAQQMRSVGAQSDRLRKNIGEIFEGLNIEPVLNGLQTLVGLFDKNSAAGQTVKFLFESIFQPLINQAERAAYVVEAFALGFLIGLTKVYIEIKPLIRTISDLFGFEDTSLADTLNFVTIAAKAAAYVFAGFVAIAGLVAIALLAAGVAIMSPIIALTALVAAAVWAGTALYDAIVGNWEEIKGFLASLPSTLVQMGTDLIRGLAAGITGGASLVVEALGGVVSSAINMAKEKLGIASPSKVFAEIGLYTAEGFAGGVEDGEGEAQSALASMVSPPEVAAVATSSEAPAAAPASGGASANLSGAVFNFYGVEGAEQAVQRFEEALTRILEGDAIQVAGAPA